MSNKFYTRYSRPPAIIEDTSMPSQTEQQFGPDCDINRLFKTYTDKNGKQHVYSTGASSVLTPNLNEPIYGDFTQFTPEGLMNSLNIVAKARSMFLELPSEIRDRFSNDPNKLVKFLSDEKNYDEAAKLGLVKSKVLPDVSLPVTNQPVSTDKVTSDKDVT